MFSTVKKNYGFVVEYYAADISVNCIMDAVNIEINNDRNRMSKIILANIVNYVIKKLQDSKLIHARGITV